MLLGRDHEIGEIQRLIADVRAARGRSVLITGDPGIGKTALLQHARAEATGTRVVGTVGVEAEANLPFAALADVAGPLVDHLDALPAPQADAIRAALALTDAPPPAGDRLAACAGLHGLLREAARRQPLLVLVDDAQWLDAPSAECLGYAARRLDGAQVAVLAAARTDTPVPALTGRPIDSLTVAGLEQDDAATLLRSSAGELAPSAAEALLEAAHGSPLALLELPSLLTDEQRRGVQPFTPAPAPGGDLWEAFSLRLARLSVPARTATLAAALSVDRTVGPVVAACVDLGLGVSALEEAEEARIVRLDAGTVTLTHPLLRGVVVQSAPGAERRRVHTALAAHTRPDARAWHLAAAAVGPSAEAADALDGAGRRAIGRGAHTVAADAFQRAAELTGDTSSRVGRRVQAAVEAAYGGEYERAATLLDQVLDEVTEPGVRLVARHLQAVIALVGGIRPVLDNYDVLDAEARAVAATAPAVAATLHADAAMVSVVGGDCRRAVASAQAAAAALPAEADATARCHVQAILGMTLALRGDVEAARPALRSAGELLGEVDPLSPVAGSISFALHGRICLGDAGLLRDEVIRIADAVRAAGARGLVPHHLLVGADAALRLGRWDDAERESDEAAEIARLCGQRGPLAAALVVRARLHAARGREEACRDDVAEVLAIADAAGYATSALGIHAVLGFLELGLGQMGRAVEVLERVAVRAPEVGITDPVTIPWAPDLVEAYCRVARLDDARALTAEIQAHARDGGVPLALALAARCEGLTADDDFDDAFTRALALHDEVASPFERGRTLLAWGARLHRARRRVEAREHLRAAREAFVALGAAPWAGRAEAELRAAGAVSRAAVGDDDELTAQEHRIALAVARGATNREVAAELYLSPKTVEFHLGRVYRKLGVRSRTELAALVAEGELAN